MKQDTLIHIAQVGAANIAAWGITLSDSNEVLKTISLGLACAYTIYRFYKDTKKK